MLRPRRLAALVAALLAGSLPAAAPAGDADTDGDGLPDDVERDGVPGEPLLDFPRFGADPAVPDIFVQLDWQACDPIVEYCGPMNSLDQHRATPAAIARLEAFFAPDFAVHVDVGQWGGARRQPIGPHRCDATVLGARYGSFHRGVTSPLGSGGGGALGGYCFGGDGVRMGVLAQELGHNFTLEHFGTAASGAANCKPHYRSPMNYGFTFDMSVTAFSRGRFADVALNPTALDELAGLGTTDPEVLAYLRAPPWEFNVRADGAIDWNRDGRFEPLVRGAPTWAWASCEQSATRLDTLGRADHPTIAWLQPADGPARLYLVARDREEGWLEARVATRLDLCEPAGPPGACTNWSPPPGLEARVVPGSARGGGAPALAAAVEGGRPTLVVVYGDAAGRLRWQSLVVEGEVERWTSAELVADAPVEGDPALAPLGDGLILLAPAGGALWRRDRDPATGAFGAAAAQTWLDGTPIEPCAGAGVALARGFRRDRGEGLFLVVPVAPTCALEFATFDEATGRWERLPDDAWPPHRGMAGARPGLAYVPFDPATPDEGRFYLAWRPYPAGAALVSMTEGNDGASDATERRLRWYRPTFLTNVWGIVAGAISLAHDPARDTNLRAAWGYSEASMVVFQPFADGVVEIELRDDDDYAVIRAHLACSLTASCPR